MKNTIERVAEVYGVVPEVVEAEIQVAIDAAWNDPACREMQQLLFPEGKPSPALFIKRMAEYARQGRF